MYQEAIRNLSAAIKYNINQDDGFIANVGLINALIHIKMDINLTKLNLDFLSKVYNKSHQNSHSSLCQFNQLITFLKVSKNQLSIFIQKLNLKRCEIHIHNYYNLALICKKHHLTSIATNLLLNLIRQCETKQFEVIRVKSSVLLSQVYEDDFNIQASINCLEKISPVDQEISQQIKRKINSLKKDIKIKQIADSCSDKSLSQNKQYYLLSNVQDQLNKLIKKQSFKAQNMMKARNLLPKDKKLKLTNLKVNNKYAISQNTSVNIRKLSQLKEIKCKRVIREMPLLTQIPKTSVTILSQKTPSSSAKSIHLFCKNMDERQLSILLVQCQQKISKLIAQQKIEDATYQIQNVIDGLEELENQLERQVFDFRLKCINWCYKMGKKKYVFLIIKRFIKIYRQRQDKNNLIFLLYKLSEHYEQSRQYKNAITVNKEIFQLGQIEALDKIGQLHILCKDYSQSLNSYERYDKIKKDLYSRIKLAHVYSKIIGCTKKTIQIINEILFSNKNDCIYKKFACQEMQHIQNVVMLLSTIYMNMDSIQKAIDICQRYLEQHFNAYPVLYLLAIMYFRKGNPDKAFSCLVKSLRFKPDHLPSLLQLVNYVGTNQFHNQQILKILRKAFIINNRNWRLLKLLIAVLTKSPVSLNQQNIQNLIQFARVLQQQKSIECDFLMEIEVVWVWCMQLMQERKKKISVINCFDEYLSTIYMRLGEINLQKGNYPLSEMYFNKILVMIQIERMRSTKNKQSKQLVKLQMDLLRKLAFLKSKQLKLEQSIHFLEKSQRIATSNLLKVEADQDLYKIGQIYLQFGQYQSAITKFKLFVQKDVKKEIQNNLDKQIQTNLYFWVNVQMKIAECFTGLKKSKQAKKTYQTILNHKMEKKAVRQLINIYIREGNNKYAQQLQQSLQDYLNHNRQILNKIQMS